MTKKTSRIVGAILLAGAIVFFLYALNHPEASFPWSNTITYTLYGAYLVVTAVLLLAPFRKKEKP